MLDALTVPDAQRGMGGLSQAQLIEAEGLEATPTEVLTTPTGQAVGLTLSLSALSLVPNYAWAEVYHTPFSGTYREETTTTDDGELTTVTVQLFVPGADPVNRGQICYLKGRRLALLVEDNMGERRLLGFAGQWMRLDRTQFNTQVEAGGRRGTLLEFTGRFTQLPPAVID